jgi:hypothetical protein
MRTVCGLFVLIGVLSAPPAGADTAYHSSSGFSLSIPDGWTEIPRSAIDDMSRRIFSGAGSKVIHDAGFQPKGTEWFTYPYVMTQVINYPVSRPPNEKEMRQILQHIAGGAANIQNQPLSAEAKEILKNVQTSAPTFDAAKRTFVLPLTLTVPGIGQVKGVAVGHFGTSSLVQVCCYDRVGSYASNEPTFAKILDSFKFDASAAYPSSALGRNPLGTIGAIAIVLVVVGLIVRAMRRRA